MNDVFVDILKQIDSINPMRIIEIYLIFFDFEP